MTAMFIISLIVLGFMTAGNLFLTTVGDDDLTVIFFLNTLAMAFAIVTIAIALGS